jgi:hypothetical protein
MAPTTRRQGCQCASPRGGRLPDLGTNPRSSGYAVALAQLQLAVWGATVLVTAVARQGPTIVPDLREWRMGESQPFGLIRNESDSSEVLMRSDKRSSPHAAFASWSSGAPGPRVGSPTSSIRGVETPETARRWGRKRPEGLDRGPLAGLRRPLRRKGV